MQVAQQQQNYPFQQHPHQVALHQHPHAHQHQHQHQHQQRPISYASGASLSYISENSHESTQADPGDERRRLDRKIYEARVFLLTLLIRRNQLLPVSFLSPDIMARIFAFAAPHQPLKRKSRQQIAVLAGVCRYWRQVMLDPRCAHFWSHIPTNPALENWARLCLDYSKNSLLTIEVDEHSSDVLPRTFPPETYHRIRALQATKAPPSLLAGLPVRSGQWTTCPQNLHTLELTQVEIPQHFFGGIPPMLRRLHLRECTVNPTWLDPSTQMWDLARFSMENCTVIPPKPITTLLLPLVRAMPNLTHLAFSDTARAGPVFEVSNLRAMQPVQLERLRELAITGGSSPDDVVQLVRHLAFPHTTKVRLDFRAPGPRLKELIKTVHKCRMRAGAFRGVRATAVQMRDGANEAAFNFRTVFPGAELVPVGAAAEGDTTVATRLPETEVLRELFLDSTVSLSIAVSSPWTFLQPEVYPQLALLEHLALTLNPARHAEAFVFLEYLAGRPQTLHKRSFLHSPQEQQQQLTFPLPSLRDLQIYVVVSNEYTRDMFDLLLGNLTSTFGRRRQYGLPLEALHFRVPCSARKGDFYLSRRKREEVVRALKTIVEDLLVDFL